MFSDLIIAYLKRLSVRTSAITGFWLITVDNYLKCDHRSLPIRLATLQSAATTLISLTRRCHSVEIYYRTQRLSFTESVAVNRVSVINITVSAIVIMGYFVRIVQLNLRHAINCLILIKLFLIICLLVVVNCCWKHIKKFWKCVCIVVRCVALLRDKSLSNQSMQNI